MKTYDIYGLCGWDEHATLVRKTLKADDHWENHSKLQKMFKADAYWKNHLKVTLEVALRTIWEAKIWIEAQKDFTISPPNVVCSASPVPFLLLLLLLLRKELFHLVNLRFWLPCLAASHPALLRLKLLWAEALNPKPLWKNFNAMNATHFQLS